MKKLLLNKYYMTKKEIVMLWLSNYQDSASTKDLYDWIKFYALDTFAQRLVVGRKTAGDANFRFGLDLDECEVLELQEYLLKRKDFVMKYLVKNVNHVLGTHLYQLYLQYLGNYLSDEEKDMLLTGYLQMMENLTGCDFSEKEKKLRIQFGI